MSYVKSVDTYGVFDQLSLRGIQQDEAKFELYRKPSPISHHKRMARGVWGRQADGTRGQGSEGSLGVHRDDRDRKFWEDLNRGHGADNEEGTGAIKALKDGSCDLMALLDE